MSANNTFTVNNRSVEIDLDMTGDMPLLWFLRDILKLNGTKYSCGIGQCGACIVHIDGFPVNSCTLPVSSVVGKSVTTIEGVAQDVLHPVQKAWVELQVAQCGYCQSGQIMSAIALLSKNTNPTDLEIDNAMKNNLCRCGTYPRIRSAIHKAADLLNKVS